MRHGLLSTVCIKQNIYMSVSYTHLTIRDVDEILVMEKGEIVQRGNHETLRHEEGLYRMLISNE